MQLSPVSARESDKNARTSLRAKEMLQGMGAQLCEKWRRKVTARTFSRVDMLSVGVMGRIVCTQHDPVVVL